MVCLMIADNNGIPNGIRAEYQLFTDIVMWIALLLTLVSLIDYVWKNKEVMAETK